MEVNKESGTPMFDIKNQAEITKMFEYVVGECRAAIDRMGEKGIDALITSTFVCNSILNGLGIDNTVISHRYYNVGYHFIAVPLNIGEAKYIYVLDPMYKELLEHEQADLNFINKFFEKDASRKQFIDKLIRQGYFRYNANEMKIYGDLLGLMIYNQNRPLKKQVYETNISGKEYLNNMILRKIHKNIDEKRR